MRLSLLIITLVLFPLAASAEGRTSVHLFQYGSTNTPETETAFLDFRDLMTEKMPRLASELLSEQDLPEVGELRLEPVTSSDGHGLAQPSDLIASLEARRNYWLTTGALALLTGRVKRTQGDNLAIHSTFFLGKLGRAHGTEAIDVELPFTAATYDTTRDSHSVAVIYALAMDLADDCSELSDVLFLLSQAELRADAVAEDDPALGQRLEDVIRNAIESAQTACPTQ